MYKYFTFNPKDINDFFKEEDIYKYCKACNTKTLRATKFCTECGCKDFYEDHKSYLMATTKYCTVCLSKVKGSKCSCGSTDLTSAEKAFNKLNEKYLVNNSLSVDAVKQKIAAKEKLCEEKNQELRNATSKVNELIKKHDEHLLTVKKIEENRLKELAKYQVVKNVKVSDVKNLTSTDIKGQKIILETMQENLMDAISNVDKMSEKANEYHNLVDIYGEIYTKIKVGEDFKDNVLKADPDYRQAIEILERRSDGDVAIKHLTHAEELKHPGAIQRMATIRLRRKDDYKGSFVNYFQALNLLTQFLRVSTRKDGGAAENMAGIFFEELPLYMNSSIKDRKYFKDLSEEYKAAYSQYANSPTQQAKKGR